MSTNTSFISLPDLIGDNGMEEAWVNSDIDVQIYFKLLIATNAIIKKKNKLRLGLLL